MAWEPVELEAIFWDSQMSSPVSPDNDIIRARLIKGDGGLGPYDLIEVCRAGGTIEQFPAQQLYGWRLKERAGGKT